MKNTLKKMKKIDMLKKMIKINMLKKSYTKNPVNMIGMHQK